MRTNFGVALGIPKEVFEQRWKECEKTYPLRRIGESDDIAKAILYLASNDASFITGINLVADGGGLWTAPPPMKQN